MDPIRFDSRAEQLFAAYCAAREAGELADLDALCRAHPEFADDLRRQESLMGFVRRLLGPASVASISPSVTDRLRAAYGDDAVSGISLGPGRGSRGVEATLRRVAVDPQRSGRYAVEDEVGRGGMGVVHRAFDRDIGRDVALKTMRTAVSIDAGAPGRGVDSADRRAVQRFLEEAQVTGQLDHPGIVPVHELGIDASGRLFFTMRLVQGEELGAIFEHVRAGRAGWTLVRALGVLLRVCETLAFAHSRGVVHRDLKPSNVMVGEYGEVVVMDWGLARILDRPEAPVPEGGEKCARPVRPPSRDGGQVTLEGDVLGTPSYMPPEQASGDLARIGPHSDAYAVGALLYELLSGAAPYVAPGQRHSSAAVLAALRAGGPEPVERSAPTAPRELVAICRKAMARDIGERYASTQALAADLRAYLEGRVVTTYASGPWMVARKWVARNRALAGAMAGIVLAITIGGIVTLKQMGRALAAERGQAARADEVFRLSAMQELEDLVVDAKTLWPPVPAQREGLERWVRRAETLLAELPRHVAQREALDVDVSRPPEQRRWWKANLTKLIDSLTALTEPRTGLHSDSPDAVTREFGWSIPRRLEFARSVEERTLTGPEVRSAWEETIAGVAASTRYGGLALAPQLGLVPLGPDPDSGLFEFAHLASGDVPVRGGDGRLVLTPTMGVVLVLIPGGTFEMGAQATDPMASNYDPEADSNEGPVRNVSLSPYFIGKYELTQGQWLVLNGHNPSAYRPESYPPEWTHLRVPMTHLLPVERVSWDQSVTVLSWVGLALPSEAQWEHACRAGTTTPLWSGMLDESARLVANFADQFARDSGSKMSRFYDWDDGFNATAPVGAQRANPFGLHEVHGNVWEWCADDFHYQQAVSLTVDPLFQQEGIPDRALRGGSFNNASSGNRATYRYDLIAESAVHMVGARAFRPIEPRSR